MSAEVTVTIAGVRRKVAPGVRVLELLNDLPRGNGKANYVAARVNGKLYDLSRTIDVDAEVEPLAAESPEGPNCDFKMGYSLYEGHGFQPCPSSRVSFPSRKVPSPSVRLSDVTATVGTPRSAILISDLISKGGSQCHFVQSRQCNSLDRHPNLDSFG